MGAPSFLLPRIHAMMSTTGCTYEEACSFFGKRGAAKKKHLAEIRSGSEWARKRMHTLALWAPWAKAHESARRYTGEQRLDHRENGLDNAEEDCPTLHTAIGE